MCVRQECHIREPLRLLDLQDQLTLREYSQGSAWTGWRDCVTLHQHRSTRKKGNLEGMEQPCVLLSWVFSDHSGHLGNDAQLVFSKSLWFLSVYLFHIFMLSNRICALLPNWLFFIQSSGLWAFLVGKIFITFLLCARQPHTFVQSRFTQSRFTWL